MKTLKQIAQELGYTDASYLRLKLKRLGADPMTLERFQGKNKHGGCPILYSEASEQYIKEVAGKRYRVYKPKEMRVTTKPLPAKDSSFEPVQPVAQKAEKKAAPTKTMKPEVSAPKKDREIKEQAALSATPGKTAQIDLDRRLQQLQVLGEVLVSQINQLTAEVSGQNAKPVASATYIAS